MAGSSTIDYDSLAQEAMRGVVRSVLASVQRNGGLPGDHHFYIAFDTRHPGVVMSRRLKTKYPEEMTIVLQHLFTDLSVSDHRFEVRLTFGGIPERLAIPFAAIKVFLDPSVPFSLMFDGEARNSGQAIVETEGTSNQEGDAGVDRPGPATGSVAGRIAASTGPRLATGGERGEAERGEKRRATRRGRAERENDSERESPPNPGVDGAVGASAEGKVEETTPAPDGSGGSKVVSLDRFRKKP